MLIDIGTDMTSQDELCIEIAESRDDVIAMVKGLAPTYELHHGVIYTQPALIHAVDQSTRRLPGKAVDLIDAAGARSRMLGQMFVTTAEIEHVLSAWTTEPPRGLEDALKTSLVGQDEAVDAVSRCIRRARVGIRDETKPRGSFLFTGPSGVGKTEMAKLLARECFGGAEAVVRLDGGGCMEQVRRRPCSLVLLDEVERAGGEVLNLLLRILDDGRVRDEKGKTVDFRATIVIVTSNVVSGLLREELIQRLDQVVEFKRLEKEDMVGVLEIMLQKLCDRVAEKKRIEVRLSEGLKEKLIEEGCRKSCSGRELKRTVTRLVEDKLAEEILNGSVGETHKVTMDVGFGGEVLIWGW